MRKVEEGRNTFVGDGFTLVVEGWGYPDFDWFHPLPLYYTWDHSGPEERYQRITVDVGGKVLILEQWSRRGHIWREVKGGITQEIWYKEWWEGAELHKDIWVETGGEKGHIHVIEADGMRIRYMFRKAKKDMGEEPGFFWYKEAHVEGQPRDLVKEILGTRTSLGGKGQDFGFHKYPSDVWLKYWYDGKVLWVCKEHVKGNVIERKIETERKKLKV